MADCSYIRCIQERRFVKRELQKWYKNMVYIVGEYKFFISLKSILKFIITHTKAHCVIMYTRKKEKKYHPTHHIFFISWISPSKCCLLLQKLFFSASPFRFSISPSNTPSSFSYIQKSRKRKLFLLLLAALVEIASK